MGKSHLTSETPPENQTSDQTVLFPVFPWWKVRALKSYQQMLVRAEWESRVLERRQCGLPGPAGYFLPSQTVLAP